MKNRKLIIFITILLLGTISGVHAHKQKKTILFPEREYIRKHSEVFFKKINLEFPLISRVNFFVRSAAYRSAYINLSETITKNHFLKEILPRFRENNQSLIHTFNEKYKKDLAIESYGQQLQELNITKVKFHLLVVFTICNDYLNSKLSGTNAFKLWNILLKMTEAAYKEKGNTTERAAVLSLSSHFVFFKKAKKWQKKARKLLKKIPVNSIDDIDVLLILKK